jgi:hypothetical protein
MMEDYQPKELIKKWFINYLTDFLMKNNLKLLITKPKKLLVLISELISSYLLFPMVWLFLVNHLPELLTNLNGYYGLKVNLFPMVSYPQLTQFNCNMLMKLMKKMILKELLT